MDIFVGYLHYAIALATMAGIYAVMALGLNLNWGVTGLFNVGVAGFFAIGAYTSAILTTQITDKHLGGYDMPIAVGLIGAMITSGIIAWGVGRICIRLRSDYLAIATIGIAEIFRLILKNEMWATNGTRGISNIPKPMEALVQPYGPLPQLVGPISFLALVIAIVLVVYWLMERGRSSPWGRVMMAIRDNEPAARAAGKNVERLRIQAFVIGSMLMGLGGALNAHYFKFVGPELTDPLLTTFILWVMLIVGGSGNNKGAILGCFVIWILWSGTELLTLQASGDWAQRIPFMRMFLIGLVLQIVLQKFPGGLLPEKLPEGRKDKPDASG